jgi:hypothetical protein
MDHQRIRETTTQKPTHQITENKKKPGLQIPSKTTTGICHHSLGSKSQKSNRQNRKSAARYVTGRHRNRSSINTMLEDLKWKSLQTRRKEARLIMMYKIINNMVAINSENHFNKPTKKSKHVQNHSYAIPSPTKEQS